MVGGIDGLGSGEAGHGDDDRRQGDQHEEEAVGQVSGQDRAVGGFEPLEQVDEKIDEDVVLPLGLGPSVSSRHRTAGVFAQTSGMAHHPI